MPIRPELRSFYTGAAWAELTHWIRFVRAGGRCERCSRPHGQKIRHLPDGRWFDAEHNIWRDGRGGTAAWPDLFEQGTVRTHRLWLSTAHLDSNPANNDPANLAALCPVCHLNHDRPYHRVQIRLTIRMRYALGDLFDGPYVRPVGIQQTRVLAPPNRPVPTWRDRRAAARSGTPPAPRKAPVLPAVLH
jgi:hypothetical protein